MFTISQTIMLSAALFGSIHMTSVSLQEINKLSLSPNVDPFIMFANTTLFVGSVTYFLFIAEKIGNLILHK